MSFAADDNPPDGSHFRQAPAPVTAPEMVPVDELSRHDVPNPVSGDSTALPPPPPPVLEASLKKNQRFTPKQLLVTCLTTLIGVVGGTLIANRLTHNTSSYDQAMGKWMSSYGSHYLGVSHDVATVNSATDATSLGAACAKLQGDVDVAQADPAMPLSSLERQWSVVLSNLSTAAADCVNGIDQADSGLINTAQSHMFNASEAYLALVKAIQQAGG